MALKGRFKKIVAPLLVGALALTSLTIIAMDQTQAPATPPPAVSQAADDQTKATVDQQDENVKESDEKDAVENEQSDAQDKATGADTEESDSAADNDNIEVEN